MDSTLDPFARAMEARLRRRMFESSCPQVKIGRFLVDMPIGQGGMGVVYAARDEQLDRTIALKLVHAESPPSDHAQLRLLREAQAMARLSHPNVVQVFEAGAHEDQVFIAMEYVRGETLDRWLRREARGWRETVAIFCQAGRGLAAAHKLGIVHRDFKPTNVLVGEDGRARVTDFGLARHVDVREPESAEPPRRVLDVALTLTDAEPGTPFYMSPEQFKRERVSERSDQFSFCVALYHALFGMRPFAGETRHALVAAVTSGALRTPPRGRVPWRVHNAVLRGLSLDPESRFPDMDTLLVELATRARVGVVLPVAFALVAAAAVANSFSSAEPPCTDGATHLEDIWDDETRDELEREFLRGAPGSGAALWTSTEEQLSRYLSDWRAAYRDNCEVHRAGKTSARLRDLRARCLEQRLDVIRGITQVLRDGDGETLRRAPQAAARLEDLTVCTSSRSLLLGVEPPPFGHTVEIANLRNELTRARSEELLGQLESGRERARRALERAEALAYTPLVAEAQLELGRVEHKRRDYAAAREALQQAGLHAIRGGHDEIMAQSRAWLVATATITDNTPVEAREWLREAEAWQTRVESGPRERAFLQLYRSLVHSLGGDLDAAERGLRRAIEMYSAFAQPTDTELLGAREHLANILIRRRGPAAMREALGEYREVLALRDRVLGPTHPDQIMVRFNLGSTLVELGGHYLEEARPHLTRALELAEARYGHDHVELGNKLLALAALDLQEARVEEALLLARRARAIYREHRPAGHLDLAFSAHLEGLLLSKTGAHLDALARFQEAYEIWSRGQPDSEFSAIAEVGLGRAHLELGELDRAERALSHAVARFEQKLGSRSAYEVEPLSLLTRVALERDDPCGAVAFAGRARETMNANDMRDNDDLERVATKLDVFADRCASARRD
ncbi:MAG: serine/threonine protein kinase [Myxococcales bacterium]|nr:serine/threonine protein kinase [Myxococcales bacterium]